MGVVSPSTMWDPRDQTQAISLSGKQLYPLSQFPSPRTYLAPLLMLMNVRVGPALKWKSETLEYIGVQPVNRIP